MMIKRFVFNLLAAAVLTAGSTLHASTVLSFDPVALGDSVPGDSVFQDNGSFTGESLGNTESLYGHAVTGYNSDFSSANGGTSYFYGTTDGFTPAGFYTPNVRMLWGPYAMVAGDDATWDQYGSLDNVMVSYSPNGPWENALTLIADPGYVAIMESFDVAKLSFYEPAVTLLWAVFVDGAYHSSGVYDDVSSAGSTTISLGLPYGNVVELWLGETSPYHGGALGYDNIVISQAEAPVIPEPSAALLACLGSAGLLCIRRRRR